MDTKENILISAKNTILSESESIAKLIDYIDVNFAEAAQIIFNSKGRLIVAGIGKSAIIAQKMVATLQFYGNSSPLFTRLRSDSWRFGNGYNPMILSFVLQKAAIVPK